MGTRCAWMLLAGLLLCSPGQSAFGAVSSFVPVNARAYRLRQPDGAVRMFVRDADEPNLLHGEGGWTAELDGRKALVMKDARTGFMFLDGHLQRMLRGGKERKVALPPPGEDARALAALWPAEGKRLVATEPPDIWKDGSRLRLWFDNPNKAGLLFAELAIAALALLFCRPLWLRIVGGGLSAAAFVGLVQTSSRGALLAFLCGVAAMGATRLRTLFSWRRLLLVAAAALVAVGCLFLSGQFDRMGRNLLNEGQREMSRLTVWKEVPRMMVDAPGGWGRGQSARAYIDWYQPKSECLLKDLISGHLTFLAESGWTVRTLYLFVWFMVLLLACVQALKGAPPVPLAALVSFAVAACFNPVISVPELWVVPLLAAAAVLREQLLRPLSRKGLGFVSLGALAAIAVAYGFVFAWAAAHSGAVSVCRCGNAVLLNGRQPDIWMVDDDYVLHGGYWWLEGQGVREHFAKNRNAAALGYVRAVADLPPSAGKVVLVGEAGRDFLALAQRPAAKKLVFISPPFSWRDIPEALQKECELSFIAGEHAARLASGGGKPPSWVKIIPGAELYVPAWMRYVL